MDINTVVKLKNPDKGEEEILYKVVNYNEVTDRYYIEPINLNLPIPPQELVSSDDIIEV